MSSSGSLYVFSQSPRSQWLVDLAKFTGHSVEALEAKDQANFGELFPLKRTPSYLTPCGKKLTEFLAIAYHFMLHSEKRDLIGTTDDEKVENLRWLSYFNSDFFEGMFKIVFSPYDEEKVKGKEQIKQALEYIDATLAGSEHKYLINDTVLSADLYAFYVVSCSARFGFELSEFKNISAYLESVKTSPFFG